MNKLVIVLIIVTLMGCATTQSRNELYEAELLFQEAESLYETTCLNANLSAADLTDCQERIFPLLLSLQETIEKEKLIRSIISRSRESYVYQGSPRRHGTPVTQGDSQQHGTSVYREDQCIGAVVNGVCHGSILAPGYTPQRCYGQMLFGECTGPMF